MTYTNSQRIQVYKGTSSSGTLIFSILNDADVTTSPTFFLPKGQSLYSNGRGTVQTILYWHYSGTALMSLLIIASWATLNH